MYANHVKKYNSETMKAANRSRILGLIREGGTTRAQLSVDTGLTRAAVSIIVNDCINENLIIETDKKCNLIGRKATMLQLHAEYGFIAGIYITRNKFLVGLIRFDGSLVCREEMRIQNDDRLEDVLERIFSMLDGFLAKFKGNLLGIGITAPGPQDRNAGKLLEISYWKAFSNAPLKEIFEKRYKVITFLDNISTAFARAEIWCRNDLDGPYAELVVDDGFGSCIAERKDGKVRLQECELGHTTVNMNGAVCSCGNVGCAELYIAVPFVKKAAKTFTDNDSFRYIINHHAELLHNMNQAIAASIVNCVNIFHVKNIVFAGQPVTCFDAYIKTIKALVEKHLKSNAPILSATALKEREIFVAGNLVLEEILACRCEV